MDKTLMKRMCRVAPGTNKLFGSAPYIAPLVLSPKGAIEAKVIVERGLTTMYGSPNSVISNGLEYLGVGSTGLIGKDGQIGGCYSGTQAVNDLILSRLNAQLFSCSPGNILSIHTYEMKAPFKVYGCKLISSNVRAVRLPVNRFTNLNKDDMDSTKIIEALRVPAHIPSGSSKESIVKGYYQLLVDVQAVYYSRRIVFSEYDLDNLAIGGMFYTTKRVGFMPDYRDLKLVTGKRIRESIVEMLDVARTRLIELTGVDELPTATEAFGLSLANELLCNVGITKEMRKVLSNEPIYHDFKTKYAAMLLERTDETYELEFDVKYWSKPKTYTGTIGRHWCYLTQAIFDGKGIEIDVVNLGKNTLALLSKELRNEARCHHLAHMLDNSRMFVKLFVNDSKKHLELAEPGIDLPPMMFSKRVERLESLLKHGLTIKYMEHVE